MAIEHTRVVQKVDCYPTGNVVVTYLHKFDDPEDDLLPTETVKIINIAPNEDTSSHDQFVQDICAGAWLNLEIPTLGEFDEQV